MDICALLDDAKQGAGVTSDRQLGLRIGVASSNITSWRKGKSLPADNSLVAVARLAGVDPVPLLIELNMLRSDGEAASIYGELLARHGKPQPLVAAE